MTGQEGGPAQAVLDGAEGRQEYDASEPSWFKTLPKHNGFNPGSREEELNRWRNFCWGLEVMDGEFVNDGKDLRERRERPVNPRYLYSILASLVRQRPLALIKQVKQANGLEAYRLLINSLEPASKNRSLGLLTMVLEWGAFDGKKGNLPNQLLKLEVWGIRTNRHETRRHHQGRGPHDWAAEGLAAAQCGGGPRLQQAARGHRPV